MRRYAAIADDLAEVTHDPRTAALLVALAVHESGFRLDVDNATTLGDAGRSCGLWQLGSVDCQTTSRADQARIALARVRRSFRACSANDERFRLAIYASGSCDRGRRESAAVIDSWRRILAAHPPVIR
ncbi:MAG TPA: hypothetical protein VGQ38_15565 [Gaiellaceae bacterium]|nr:hypothetical protein [Gaiellaceae bacterium]